MTLQQKVEQYTLAKQNALAATSLRAAQGQIAKYGDLTYPQTLWSALSNLKAYSRTVTYQRLAEFHAFFGDASFKDWRKANARLFKNVYTFKPVGITYSAAVEAISRMDCVEAQGRATQILKSGQRWSESLQQGDVVVGKGGKVRPAYANHSPYQKSYSSFLRALKKVGLKPHDLRKLAVTRAAEKGASAADLCRIAGWADISTAYRYLQPKQDDVLRGYLE